LRKFYIALKNTDKSKEEHKIVIEKLVTDSLINNSLYKTNDESSLSKEENGIIKDLLNNLMKKL